MRLTKHAHACVTLDRSAAHLVLDPGVFTPDAADLIDGTNVVLVTHEHPDHFDEAAIATALADRPEFKVYGPEAVVGRWDGRPGQVTAVRDGDRFEADGFEVTVHGELHAAIHADIPRVANVGYLVAGEVYHPGDAYHVPPVPVSTLLVPTSGPWTKVGEAVDFVRGVDADRVIQIHEVMLSEMGQQFVARFLGPEELGRVPVTLLDAGQSLDL